MSGIRRAAAALYGLQREDREAILAQLSVHEQEQLGAAMAEMESLGFARNIDAALREDEPVLHDARESVIVVDDRLAATAGTLQEAQLTSVLATAQPSQIGTVLSREPSNLIADVLHIAVWPWADAFLKGLQQPVQCEVRAVLFSTRPAAPARRLWLLRTLVQRVALAAPMAAGTVLTRPAHKRLWWFPWRA